MAHIKSKIVPYWVVFLTLWRVPQYKTTALHESYLLRLFLVKNELISMEFSKGFFPHQSQEAMAFSLLSLHNQSKNLCFFYELTLDHLFAKLFQESVFGKPLHVHRCHSRFQVLNLFFIILDSTSPMQFLFFFSCRKKKSVI